MATNNNKLKAFVRFDGTGRIIPGSLILQRFKPRVGKWQEIPAYECCNYTPEILLLEDGGSLLQEDNGEILL
jgi:hypothetical protein